MGYYYTIAELVLRDYFLLFISTYSRWHY